MNKSHKMEYKNRKSYFDIIQCDLWDINDCVCARHFSPVLFFTFYYIFRGSKLYFSGIVVSTSFVVAFIRNVHFKSMTFNVYEKAIASPDTIHFRLLIEMVNGVQMIFVTCRHLRNGLDFINPFQWVQHFAERNIGNQNL